MFNDVGNVFGHGDVKADDDKDTNQDMAEEKESLLDTTTIIEEQQGTSPEESPNQSSLRQRRGSQSTMKKKRLSFNAIRTAPFHRRSSWQPKEEEQDQQQQKEDSSTGDQTMVQESTSTTTTTTTKESSTTTNANFWDIILFKKWHVYDNNGSFNGWFDWLPIWMRVGYWSPIFVCSMIGFYYSLIKYKPTPLEFPASTSSINAMTMMDSTTDNNYWWSAADWIVCIWGIFVVVHAKLTMGNISGFYISYTGWSWCILTARAGFEASSRFLMTTLSPSVSEKLIFLGWNIPQTLAVWGSALKFPAAVAAVITFTIWNFILFPLIYFGSMKDSKKRTDFLKFNFSFFMSNIHLLNLPMALVNTVWGPTARIFTESDLWIALMIAALYSLLYLFFLDRLGLHFYPIFCPRFSLSTISFGLVLYLYWFLMQQGNKAIVYFNPSLE